MIYEQLTIKTNKNMEQTIVFATVATLLLVLSLLGIAMYFKTNKYHVWLVPSLIILLCAGMFIGLALQPHTEEIPAIEVYRGTTTLKINGYQVDGKFVPEDSIVVYRPHIRNPALQDTTLLNK